MKELEGISELLAGLPRKSPFQVPENYFSELESRVSDWIPALAESSNDNPEEELQLLSPFLAGVKKSLPEEKSVIRVALPFAEHENNPRSSEDLHQKTRGKIFQLQHPMTRAIAAVLIVGVAAWMVKILMPAPLSEDLEWRQESAETRDFSQVDSAVMHDYIQETEFANATHTIGMEESWEDEFKDMLSGDPAVLDSTLSSLSETVLLAYVNDYKVARNE